MKTIELTQGQVALVDDEDFDRLSIHSWHARWNKSTDSYYAARGVWNRDRGQMQTVMMHRVILGVVGKTQVDHKNHQTLDNTKSNLVAVDNRKNQSNLNGKQTGRFTSSYTGVSWAEPNRKWRAQIKLNGKKIHLGLFATEREASKMYQKAKQEIVASSRT